MAFKKDDIVIIEPREIFVGKKDAPITLVEFGEYENEECAKVNEIVKQLLEEFDGKIIPISSFPPYPDSSKKFKG